MRALARNGVKTQSNITITDNWLRFKYAYEDEEMIFKKILRKLF